MGLLDPLDKTEHLAFLVPQDPLEHQVSLDSEDRRETVGTLAPREGDKRVLRVILESQAALDRVDWLVCLDRWDQWDLLDHQGPQAPPMALILMRSLRGTMEYQPSEVLQGHRAPLVLPVCLGSLVYLVAMETRVQRVQEVHLGSLAWMAFLDSRE